MVWVLAWFCNALATTAWMVNEDAIAFVCVWRSIKRSFLLIVWRPRPEPIHRACISSHFVWPQHILTVRSERFRWRPIRQKTILLLTVQLCGPSQTLLIELIVVECVVGPSLSVTLIHKHAYKLKNMYEQPQSMLLSYSTLAPSVCGTTLEPIPQSFACFPMINL